jgi:hypothetical protein
LLLREGCSEKTSLSFPFPVFSSRRRLDLAGVVRVVRRLIDSGAPTDVPGSCSELVCSLSLLFEENCNFCLAALTLALERMGLGSKDVAEET